MIFNNEASAMVNKIPVICVHIFLILFGLNNIVNAQSVSTTEGWIRVDFGHVLVYDPAEFNWKPLQANSKISLHTYILTKDSTKSFLYHKTDVYELPENSYFYLSDLITRDSLSVVRYLTKIESDQLPVDTVKTAKQKKIGVTYGNQYGNQYNGNDDYTIPFEQERQNAIKWFLDQNQIQPALFSLKRTLSAFPFLYEDINRFDLLCRLYERLNLYGFLYNDSNRILQRQAHEEIITLATMWNKKARKNIRKSH